MNDVRTKQRADPTGLPIVTIELIELTPEQLKKGEPGTLRTVEGTNSWVQGMVDLLFIYFRNAGGNFRNLSNTNRPGESTEAPKIAALTGNTTGVLVGTGTTAIDRSDFDIETEIANGSAAGELTRNVFSAITKSQAITGGYRVTIERSFTNNSGGIITINEAGIVVSTREVGSTTVVAPLILHDLISPGHAVADGGAVIVRYLLDWLA